MLSLTALIMSCAVASAPAGAYVFGGFNSGYEWGWTGPGMDGLRTAIANPANFGPGGVVSESATTTLLASVDATSLAGINCFVAPANNDTQYSPATLSAIVTWFESGGDLLLMDDRSDFDAIGEALGYPTLDGPGNGAGSHRATAVGGGPLVNGPFGAVASFSQYYLVGHLTERSVLAGDGLVAATNTSGVAVVYWPAGALGKNSGRLVIVTDVDTMGDNVGYPGAADYGAMNANAKLALNIIAYFVAAPSDCPADLNHDGTVDAADLAILLGAWLSGGPADLNGSGTVDASDLAILLGAWGPC